MNRQTAGAGPRLRSAADRRRVRRGGRVRTPGRRRAPRRRSPRVRDAYPPRCASIRRTNQSAATASASSSIADLHDHRGVALRRDVGARGRTRSVGAGRPRPMGWRFRDDDDPGLRAMREPDCHACGAAARVGGVNTLRDATATSRRPRVSAGSTGRSAIAHAVITDQSPVPAGRANSRLAPTGRATQSESRPRCRPTITDDQRGGPATPARHATSNQWWAGDSSRRR